MRRRLVLSTVIVVLVILMLMAAPVTLLLRQSATNQLEARTETAGVTVAAAIENQAIRDADGAVTGIGTTTDDIRRLVPDDIGVILLDANGNEVLSVGIDQIDSPFRRSFPTVGGYIVQTITDSSAVDSRFGGQIGQLAMLSIFCLAIAAGLAFVQARRVATPMERLARAATRLGDGDFTASAPTSSGIAEIDSIARAIRLSGNRVERMLESERGFTADATHQLRTGLTGLAIRLELLERHDDSAVSTEAATILNQIHELNATLDELLRVARKGSTGERTEINLVELVDHHIADWQALFTRKRRQLVVTTGAVDPAIGTPGLIGQILNVVIENSLKHGRGTVAILVRGTSVLIEDEGNGVSEADAATMFDRPSDHQAAHGRGLALARRLAEADGGRLELTERRPATFTLTMLAADTTRDLAPEAEPDAGDHH